MRDRDFEALLEEKTAASSGQITISLEDPYDTSEFERALKRLHLLDSEEKIIGTTILITDEQHPNRLHQITFTNSPSKSLNA